MKNYEILLIINPQFSDEEIPSFLEGIFSVIKKNNGTIKEHKILGRNKLAYPIKHAKFGVYVLVQVEVESLEVKKITAEIEIMPGILRFDVSNEVSKGDFSFKHPEIKDSIEAEITESPVSVNEEVKETKQEEKADDVTVDSETVQPSVEAVEEVEKTEKAEEPEVTVEPELEEPKEEKEEEKVKGSKVSLDELDKKLDEILKEEII